MREMDKVFDDEFRTSQGTPAGRLPYQSSLPPRRVRTGSLTPSFSARV